MPAPVGADPAEPTKPQDQRQEVKEEPCVERHVYETTTLNATHSEPVTVTQAAEPRKEVVEEPCVEKFYYETTAAESQASPEAAGVTPATWTTAPEDAGPVVAKAAPVVDTSPSVQGAPQWENSQYQQQSQQYFQQQQDHETALKQYEEYCRSLVGLLINLIY